MRNMASRAKHKLGLACCVVLVVLPLRPKAWNFLPATPPRSLRAAELQRCPGGASRPAASHSSCVRNSEARGGSLLGHFATLLCAALLALAPLVPVSSVGAFEEVLNAEEQLTVDLFQRNTPGVVYITTEVFRLANAARMEVEAVPKGSGSGWVYDAQGRIVTNYHVIENANVVTVKFIDGTEVQAKVVGADPDSDVAVLQVQLPAKQQGLLTPLTRAASSARLRVGQEVFAIGNPFGLDHTLTKGIVSGTGRTIQSVGGRPIQGAIQTDASINPGNSGGPLLNSRGEVIGMNTVIISPSGASAGVGFAIPSDTVQARVSSILKYGYVRRPSLGLYLGQDGLAERLSGQKGVIIAGLQRQSAAARAGLREGDILQEIQGRRIQQANDVFAELDEHQVGETLRLRILRPDHPEDLGVPNSGVQFSQAQTDVKLLEASTQ
eukprot:TRINITY_DN8594_c0_g3_i1.p1 TRINITY_DN8594_c0_g3~~TRINITY_DN8594_c0_g3_i1.p1  ORF type:complete len:438 (-),score=68.61 TRINITY_DN8594_c0_g3_i1:320-1633(-)